MIMHLPLKFAKNADGSPSADEDRLGNALLTGRGAVSGFRVDSESLLVSVDPKRWARVSDGAELTTEAVTRYVEHALASLDEPEEG